MKNSFISKSLILINAAQIRKGIVFKARNNDVEGLRLENAFMRLPQVQTTIPESELLKHK